MNTYFLTACSIIMLGTAACNSATPDKGGQAAEQGAQTAPAADVAESATPPAKVSAPKPTDGYDWAIRIDEEERTRPAILAYEVANTDDQPLNFTCEEGGARIFAGIDGGPDTLSAITLASGDQTLKLGGKTEQDEMPVFTSDEIAGNAPFIKAFATNGWLRMTADGKTLDMAGTPAGAKAIASFVAHCNRR